ncbi:uncharacterized protein [Epargyreus clarus]|uniref:uncharacterized protein n=1 Tax=Epargyreus clarus TaxID=520877 RepID=UPI003C2D6555
MTVSIGAHEMHAGDVTKSYIKAACWYSEPVLYQHLCNDDVTMQSIALLLVSAVVAVALAEGQYYVPRAYYTIDAEGHASPPVPLRRLRRSLAPYPYHIGGGASASANANARADASSGGPSEANANANANARAVGSLGSLGGWAVPGGAYGSSNPNALRASRY